MPGMNQSVEIPAELPGARAHGLQRPCFIQFVGRALRLKYRIQIVLRARTSERAGKRRAKRAGPGCVGLGAGKRKSRRWNDLAASLLPIRGTLAVNAC